MYDAEDLIPLALDNVKFAVDVSKLSQVIQNLVGNAIKFTPAGGTVTVSASIVQLDLPSSQESVASSPRSVSVDSKGSSRGGRRVAEKLRVVVRDTGLGISQVCLLYMYFWLIGESSHYAGETESNVSERGHV